MRARVKSLEDMMAYIDEYGNITSNSTRSFEKDKNQFGRYPDWDSRAGELAA